MVHKGQSIPLGVKMKGSCFSSSLTDCILPYHVVVNWEKCVWGGGAEVLVLMEDLIP